MRHSCHPCVTGHLSCWVTCFRNTDHKMGIDVGHQVLNKCCSQGALRAWKCKNTSGCDEDLCAGSAPCAQLVVDDENDQMNFPHIL